MRLTLWGFPKVPNSDSMAQLCDPRWEHGHGYGSKGRARGITAADLRAASAKCTDGVQVRRILAMALVLEGRPRREAAALNGMDRQTLNDWMHRFNAEGIEGLKSRKSPGRTPLLTVAQKAELRALVIQGPDPAVHHQRVIQ